MSKKTKKTPIICAFDTETEYDPSYSIRDLGVRGYVEHERFNCYLCSFANDEFSEVGDPKDIDWLKYDNATFICHNASFDQRVFGQMVRDKVIPPINATFICSADLCAYFQLPRNLAGAVRTLFKHDMPKTMRDWMKGRSWDDAVVEGKSKELSQYALDDALWCWKLYRKLYSKWPENERVLSTMTREMGWEGLPIDSKKLEESCNALEKVLWGTRNKLPWVGEIDPDTKKEFALYSKKGLAVYLRKEGLTPPKSLAKTSKDCDVWIDKHGGKCSYVADMQLYTRVNAHYKRLKTMLSRTTTENRMSYGLKLYGATASHRWSGESGWNAQNMPRAVKHGVDVRSHIKAPKGSVLCVADSAQIEPRSIALLVGDEEFLALCRQGQSPYESHARLTMNWGGGVLKDEDPELYALAKTRVLGLGYGSGWKKFLDTVAEQGMTSILESPYDRNDEQGFLSFLENVPNQGHFVEVYEKSSKRDRRHMINAWVQVMDFRRKNPLIKKAWDRHAAGFAHSAQTGGTYKIKLLSGRQMKFFRVRPELQGYSCTHAQGDKRRLREYGSSLFQKSVQATARDIFAFQLGLLHERGIKVILHVHDEIVAEIPKKLVDEKRAIIQECMTTAPEWAQNVPLDASIEITDRYLK